MHYRLIGVPGEALFILMDPIRVIPSILVARLMFPIGHPPSVYFGVRSEIWNSVYLLKYHWEKIHDSDKPFL
jgi:hypothetical protein